MLHIRQQRLNLQSNTDCFIISALDNF